jgi:hypothetical protein
MRQIDRVTMPRPRHRRLGCREYLHVARFDPFEASTAAPRTPPLGPCRWRFIRLG